MIGDEWIGWFEEKKYKRWISNLNSLAYTKKKILKKKGQLNGKD